MKCIEEPSVMSFYNNMEVQCIEVWSCNLGAKAMVSEGKLKKELKRNTFYKQYSPYNFFRENLVFETPKTLTLAHLSRDILGRPRTFLSGSDPIPSTRTLADLYRSSILDLVIEKEQSSPDSEQPAKLA